MQVAEMLVDSAAGFEYLCMFDGYSDNNQILIAEDDVLNTVFRCPGALVTYEWFVMPCLKNAEATYQKAMNAIFHDFIKKIMQFGIPETITTYQGSVFVGQKMQEFAVERGFKLVTSIPYYAQANGQVEAANKVIIGLIKKPVAKKPKNWHKTLDQVL
ncbi:uncharacterized protein LOC127104685 [Lathyrus oleraceus]|uniref:uncharacterized protein LOC127104685 n=1 Tax=Pisum sativum TaxID=3888 RepID=UPI0021CF58FD|nr:uncharacterized protein LOC127104685 [Pisum sativum]